MTDTEKLAQIAVHLQELDDLMDEFDEDGRGDPTDWHYQFADEVRVVLEEQ